jgi:formimidoylglutamate deiminase
MKLYAENILLNDGWASNQTITIEQGIITAIDAGMVKGAEIAKGAIIPGMVLVSKAVKGKIVSGLGEKLCINF